MNKTDKENVIKKSAVAEREEEILKFWQERNIFQKTLEKEAPRGEFKFFDGPPFANGLPHYGHILAGTMKDFVGRYQTMRGKHVPRRWGWDCHGLPIESVVEKEIGLKSKKDIEDFGLEKFNDIARTKIFTYVDDWKQIVPRMGRFVDMENDYRTMNPTFTESVWWVFKELEKKGLVYEGFKSMHYCPHCGTTLSNFEVSQGYKDITDISVIGKFELVDEPGTYFLAWTTTPWTLPGNVALAVNPEIDYVKIKVTKKLEPSIEPLTLQTPPPLKIENEFFIFAESRFDSMKKYLERDYSNFQVIEKIKGEKLVGISYKPLFNYYKMSELKNGENGYKVYGADFVTTEDGTGIVHIAPAFGEDDLNLGNANKLPFIQHVDHAGKFKKDVKDFAGLPVKPKENPQAADIEVLKFLSGKGLIFAKEKFTHSYPHCYRCDTPLLNYAKSSWFVEVTKIRKELVEANKKIKWVPKEIGENRFGDWLENARDWAISRERFWGAPIPVWRCHNEDCNHKEFIGSIEDLKKRTAKDNRFFVVRHGEAESNVSQILSSNPKTVNHLTDTGRKEAVQAGKNIDGQKIDVIYCSPFMRTKETAEIIADEIGYPKDKIIYDERLHEIFVGVMDGKPDADYQAFFETKKAKFWKTPEGGENYTGVKNRMTEFLYETNEKNDGKNILIVSHNTPIFLMFAGAYGYGQEEAMKMRIPGKPFIENSEIKELKFAPIPHNRNYELDMHRPFIDEIELKCSCGSKMKRIPEVFDCWFESGSMPYGESHYPFENTDKFEPKSNKGFPADFIAEGLDQTRGWFYSMLVLSVALFGESSYKNVIVNGIVLAEDGLKMAKKLKNYTDPMIIANTYGADSLRYYLLSSPAMKAEDLKFSDRGVDEVLKKIVMRLQNVYSFFEMYGGFDAEVRGGFGPKNVLDKWIIARLKETAGEMTKSVENYELDRATRPIADIVEDLSVWYLRRSRDRFKSEDVDDRYSAMVTTKIVISELSKLLAPSMPFLAEDLYLKITGGMQKESVHLDVWPEYLLDEMTKDELETIEKMNETRKVVSLGLEARSKAGIKVRQPLNCLKVKTQKLTKDYLDLIKDEINVKEVVADEKISGEVELDTNITPELKEEGTVREIIRALQEIRKNKKMNPGDLAELVVDTDENGKKMLEKYSKEISKVANLSEIDYEKTDEGELVEIEGFKGRFVLE